MFMAVLVAVAIAEFGVVLMGAYETIDLVYRWLTEQPISLYSKLAVCFGALAFILMVGMYEFVVRPLCPAGVCPQ